MFFRFRLGMVGAQMGRKPIVRFENLWDILREIEGIPKNDEKITIYRGHTNFRHKLKPGIFRSSNEKIRNSESNVLRELIIRHPSEFSGDVGTFEKLVRMQHYGLPTRLLDVTYNPLVAVYFACEGDPQEEAEIFAIQVDKKYFKYFDSDTVRCIANLSNLSHAEIKIIKDCQDSEQLNSGDAGKKLCDFVMQERPNFKPNINLEDLKKVYLVSPRLNNPRIQAQNGAFLIFGLEEELKNRSAGFSIHKIRISKSKIKEIRNSVELLGFTESAIYPELSKTAEVIRRKYNVKND